MRTRQPQQLCTRLLARLDGDKERRVVGLVPLVHARAPLQKLHQDFVTARHGGQVHRCVARIVGLLQELGALALQKLLDDAELAGLDGVAERGEGRFGSGEERGGIVETARGVGEGGVGNFGHFAADGARELLLDVLGCEAGAGEEVREFGEGGFSGEVQTEDDACAAEDGAGGVDGGDEAVDALADVDDDDTSLDAGLDDLRETSVHATGDVTHAERLQDEASEIRHAENRIDHLGLDAGEDTQTRDMGSVEALDDFKLGDARRSKNQGPVDGDAETVDDGQRFRVGARKRLEARSRDLCASIPTVQLMMEEQTNLRNHKGPRNDERAQQVIHAIRLERKDGCLGAGEDDGLSEVLHHEGEGRGGIGQGVGAVEDDEAIKEVVVVLDAHGHGVPVVGFDGTGVEKGVELEDAIADVAVVCCWGCSEGWDCDEFAFAVGGESYYFVLVSFLFHSCFPISCSIPVSPLFFFIMSFHEPLSWDTTEMRSRDSSALFFSHGNIRATNKTYLWEKHH